MNAAIRAVAGLSPDQVGSVLAAATAAPSLLNSQPWRFLCTPSTIELWADPARHLAAVDPDGRELVLACGAALFNLRLAIRAQHTYPDVRLEPQPGQPDLLAVVRPAGRRPVTPAETRLADAIRRRHTNRYPFTDEPAPEPVRHELRRAAEAERCWLAVISPTQLPTLRALVHRADHIQRSNPAFSTEWERWTGRGDTDADGVPARGAGLAPEPWDEWVRRDFTGGHARPRVPGKGFEDRPLIVVIGSFQDGRLARLQAGQAMQRVLLTATTLGLSASFLSQVVEVPETRAQLRELIGGGLWPQTVLRLGYGYPVTRTPRRDLHDVLDPALPVGPNA